MKPGDKVTWTKITGRGKTINMRLKYGTIESINGEVATVKTKGKSRLEIPLSDLRPENEPGTLTEFVKALAEKLKDQ